MTIPSPALTRIMLAVGLALLLLAAALWYRPVGALVTEPPSLTSGWQAPTAIILSTPEVTP